MTLKELKKVTEDYFQVDDIAKKTRLTKYINARFVFYHTAYRLFPEKGLAEIAHFLDQDHATMIYALKELPNILAFNNEMARSVEGFYRLLELNKDDKTEFNVPEYETIAHYKYRLLDASTRNKIKQLEKKLEQAKKIIKELRSKSA